MKAVLGGLSVITVMLFGVCLGSAGMATAEDTAAYPRDWKAWKLVRTITIPPAVCSKCHYHYEECSSRNGVCSRPDRSFGAWSALRASTLHGQAIAAEERRQQSMLRGIR